MGKRDRRRQERRRHHQAAQSEQRRERRRQVEATLERVRSAFAELAALAGDEALDPAAFADRAAGLLGEGVLATVLTDPDLGRRQGETLSQAAGAERAVALAAALEGRAEDEPGLAWVAAGLAMGAGELGVAERIAAAAQDRLEGEALAAGAETLARIRLAAGRLGDGLGVLDEACARAPMDEDLQQLRTTAMSWASRLLDGEDGDREGPFGWAVPDAGQLAAAASWLACFGDRSLVYELREALAAFVAADPALASFQDEEVASFAASVREAAGLGPFDELGGDGTLRLAGGEDGPAGVAGEALAAVAVERSWLSGPEPADGAEDLPDDQTVLGRFAAHPATPAPLAEAAQSWLAHARYGLWQPDGGTWVASTPGVWLTDLVTRRQVYAVLPDEQVEGLPRWSVLAGVLAPIGGVWRSGVALVPLDPPLADRAVEAALETADEVVRALARERGIKAPRPRRRDRERPRPHGVLASLAEPMEEAEADLTAKVLGVSLPDLIGMVEAARRRPPGLTNTDGHRLELLEASFVALDPLRVRRQLLAEADVEGDDDEEPAEGELASPLRWLGREMTDAEASSSLAQLRAEARQRGWEPIPEPEGPRRWLRGSIHFVPGRVRVDVNSRERLEAVSALLRRAGVSSEATIERQVDPAMDLALPTGRLTGGRAGEPEVEAAWRASWLDERVPALDGATPRAAAREPGGRVLLEALLRQFEHDADVAALAGDRPLDVGRLREELGMDDGPFFADEGEE